MKIVLIGFMGSGKSSVAKKLGSLLNLPILEMDERVYQKTKTKDMHQVFAKGGELLLRETEIAITQEYASTENIIISTGAGVVLNQVNMDNLKKCHGSVFFLNTNFQTILDRLACDDSRPLFKNPEEAESLYRFRLPLYLKYADSIIEVGEKPVDEIAKEIIEHSLGG